MNGTHGRLRKEKRLPPAFACLPAIIASSGLCVVTHIQ
jgi:hypothetical protein